MVVWKLQHVKSDIETAMLLFFRYKKKAIAGKKKVLKLCNLKVWATSLLENRL